jgi:hypothetical protein
MNFVINLVYPIVIATIYHCNCSDPNNHCNCSRTAMAGTAYERPTMVRAWVSVQHKLNIALAYASPLALKISSARQQQSQSSAVRQIELTEAAVAVR